MTRRTRNADGTITLKSFSYFGPDNADQALQQELDAIAAHNRKALAEWDSLTADEQEQRITAFEAEQAAWQTNDGTPAKRESHLSATVAPPLDGEGPVFI